MSAFVVSERTIHIVAKAMAQAHGVWAPCEEITKLGQRLLRMNETAVAGRYREERGTLWTTYSYSPVQATREETFRAMSCLHYQCSEDATDRLKLFKQLERARNTLACEIATDVPAVQAARWG